MPEKFNFYFFITLVPLQKCNKTFIDEMMKLRFRVHTYEIVIKKKEDSKHILCKYEKNFVNVFMKCLSAFETKIFNT